MNVQPPPVPVTRAAGSARRANQARASALLGVSEGVLQVQDVLTQAAEDPSGALLRIRLRQLLMAQPDWGPSRSEQIIRRTLSVLGETDVERARIVEIRLAWLLDNRAGGMRLAAFCEAIRPRSKSPAEPWEGFPYAPQPAGVFRRGQP